LKHANPTFFGKTRTNKFSCSFSSLQKMEKETKLDIQEINFPKGLFYIKNFCSIDESKLFIKYLDSEETKWSTDLNRNTQQFGYKFDYTTRKAINKITPIPKVFDVLLERLSLFYPDGVDQIIVNEYKKKQGISPHIDNPEYFSDVVSTLTLLCPSPMVFHELTEKKENEIRKETGEKAELFLEVNSLAVLTGDARYNFKHSIPSKENYVIDEKIIKKDENYRRISITFRKMNKDKEISIN
jgi:alkylated DNA repair dioxygenase AlkB